MKPAKLTFEARCGDCNAPTIVPTRDAEAAFSAANGGGAVHRWACRCGAFAEAAIVPLEKAPAAPKPRKEMKRTGMKRKTTRKRRSDLERRLSERWAAEARHFPCAACGRRTDYRRAIVVEGHHIVRQALLKARARVLDWTPEELARRLWDTRNRLPLCGECHRGHHSKMKKLAWSLVRNATPKVEQFAREVGLMREARRDYA